jgi:hypothetical protein
MTDTTPHIEQPKYPSLSRLIDIGAFLVLGLAIFMPVANMGVRSLSLADQTYSVELFGGAALIGPLGAIARKRWLADLGAVVYGLLFAVDVVMMNSLLKNVETDLKDNIFFYLLPHGFTWGAAVVVICVTLILCSRVIARREIVAADRELMENVRRGREEPRF